MKLNFSLAASLSAANGERFSTCKGVYYSLHILYALLPPLPSPGAVQHEIIPPPTNAEWESALAAVLDLLSGRTVPLTKNLIKVGCDCLCRVFDACRRASRNTLASTGDPGMEEIKGLDINKTLFELIERVETVSKSTAGGRLAAVMALGRLGNWAGGKSVYSLSNTLCKAITGTDTRLSIGASQALFDMLEGLGSGGRNIPTNTIAKAALKICTDRSAGPHLRKWGARLSAAVVEYGGLKSHSSLLSACIRGMDDDDASLRLAFSTAVGSILASSVKQTSDEGGGMLVGSEGQQQVKKAKRGGEVRRKKLNVIHSPDKRHPPLSESGYTVESGLSLLTAIFFQWSYPSTEREGLSGVATALVVFLRDYRNQHLVTPSAPAVCWLMTILLELLDSDNLPHSKGDAYVVRTVVQYILRNGICAHATETLQLIVSREIINLLDQYNKDSTGELGLGLGSKTLNEHQLQVCLVELSNLVTALGQAAGSLKDILVPCLLPYIRHLGYGVRVEAAVVLASVGKVLPHIGVSIVSSCVSNVDRILTTLYGRRSMNRGDGIFSPELKLDDFRESVLEKTYILKDVSEVVTSEIKKTRLFTLHGYGVTVFLLWQVISETPFGASESLKERVTELGVSLVMAPFIVENPSDKNGHVPPPIGLRCACFRTGWTILCALFQQGGKCGGKYFTLLCPLWERVVSSLKGGTIAKLPTADITLQLVFLGSCLKPLLAFIRCCLGVLYSVPGALSRIVAILDIAINLTCEELKAPSHPEGIVCRTMIKAVLMECFSFLPPGSFPSNCERLFYWGLDHVSAYNDSGIASSLLPEFLNSQDDVLDLTSTTYSEIPISSIPPTTDFESSDTAFGMHAICSGIPVGHQEREAMTLSGPMRLRTNVGYFSSEVTGEQESTYLGFDPSSHNMPDCVISPPTPLHGVHWQCPAAPVASINIRLVDSAVTIIGATFGYVGELEQMKAIDLIIGMLPEAYRPPSYESKKSELLGFGALHAALPSLRTEDVRKSRASRSAVSVHNVATLLLTLLRSLPPYTDSKFNIELPWLSNCRDVLVGLLRYPSPTVRRCAGEGIALLGEKVGNGYVIYLVQELLGILRPSVSHGKKRNIPARTGVIASKLTHRGQPPTTTSFSSTAAAEMDSSSPGLRAGTLFALSATKRRMGRQVNIEWLWAHVRSELAVGGDVPSLTRVWGLHSLAVIVQSSDDIINIATTSPNPSYPSESKLWLESVLELLEVHMLDCWPLELESSLTTVLLELMSAILQVSEGLQLESLGMEPFTASPKLGSREMTSSISWPATPTEWELTVSARLLALWCALSPQDTYGYDAVCLSRQKRGVLEDPRVAEPWLHFAESVVALAPNEVARRSVLPNIVAAALPSVSSVPCFPQTATVVTTAARLLRYLCCLLPGVAAAYKVEVPLFRSFEHMKGGAVFDGTIMWRSLMINRSVEDMCIDYQSAARVIRDVIEAIAEYDNDRDRPLCWILLCRSLTMGTGLEGNTDLFQILPTDWVQACSALRKRAAESVSVLGGVRWQVRHIAVFCCTKALRGIYLAGNIASAGGRAAGMGEGMTLLMDVNKARAEIDASLSAQRAILGQRLWESDYSYISPRYTCLFLEDIVSMAVSAAMASTADSELAELQEGGVILLTTVLLMFGLVLDPDVSEPVFVHVRGNLVRRRALFLEQSVSQISSAVRPALGSSSCPPLVRRGCVLVTVLVGLGLIVDPLVLKRLVRQVMPADLLDTHLSAEKKGITEESRDNHPLMNIVTSVIAAEEHFYRLAVVAELYLLCRDVGVSDQLTMPPVTYLLLLNSPDLPDSVALGLWKALEPYIRIIRPCWLDCCVDAVRLNQGHGQWPSLPHPAKKMGLCYPRTNNPEILHRSLNSLWPAMAAAFAMTSRLDKNVSQFVFIVLVVIPAPSLPPPFYHIDLIH